MKKLKFIVLFGILLLPNCLSQSVNYLELAKDRQFDFWVGTWDVNLRVQQSDKSWQDQIKSEAKIYSVNQGRAILELWNDQRITGIKGFSLRYYDFDKDKWILWLNWPSQNRSGLSSLSGEFRHGRGEFYSGKGDTLTRYSFSDISPHYLRWDDAFTKDGGKTWTNNWIMEFKRTEDEPDFPKGTKGHTYDQSGRCNLGGFDVFRGLVGQWTGEYSVKKDGAWKNSKASMKGFEVLNGCAVLNFLEFEADGKKQEEFSIKSFNTYAGKLEDGRIGSGKTDVLNRYFGDYVEGSKRFELTEFNPENSILKKYEWNLETEGKILIVISESPNSENPVWKKVKEISLKKK